VGNLLSVNAGEVLKLKGEWHNHPKIGKKALYYQSIQGDLNEGIVLKQIKSEYPVGTDRCLTSPFWLPHIKKQGLLRFREKDIDKWLDSDKMPAIDTPANIIKVGRKGRALP